MVDQVQTLRRVRLMQLSSVTWKRQKNLNLLNYHPLEGQWHDKVDHLGCHQLGCVVATWLGMVES